MQEHWVPLVVVERGWINKANEVVAGMAAEDAEDVQVARMAGKPAVDDRLALQQPQLQLKEMKQQQLPLQQMIAVVIMVEALDAEHMEADNNLDSWGY